MILLLIITIVVYILKLLSNLLVCILGKNLDSITFGEFLFSEMHYLTYIIIAFVLCIIFSTSCFIYIGLIIVIYYNLIEILDNLKICFK